ncbi:MAG: excinuclease ABC subunit UvrC [Ignavibacteriales bacterium]|nr:excinuclease ABC subunit UvrC [Ignavibacteriales bacterium]
MEPDLQIHIQPDDISLQDKLESLPTSPGVYQFRSADGTILYVGKANILRNRVRQYFHKSRRLEPRIAIMVEKVTDVSIIATDSEVEALILESNLIKLHKPRYNVNLKDDKSYPFIVITNEPYPRVFVTRRVFKDGSRYFGPYTDVTTMRSALRTVRDIFMIRSCNYRIDDAFIEKKKVRVCLDYHIKKCEGPCEGLIMRDRYGAMIEQVALVLQGKLTGVAKMLGQQMNDAAAALKFEEAALCRNRLRELEVYASKQKVVDGELHDRDVVAVAVESGDACGVVFKIREGKVLGRQHYFVTRQDGLTMLEVLEAVLQRYYEGAIDIPPEIILPMEWDAQRAMCEWLQLQRKESVHLIVPAEGELLRLMEMCQKNAWFLLEELKLQKLKRNNFVPGAVMSLQRDLRLQHAPRRIECFDISHLQGTETVASMVVFVDGKPKKSEYRKFKIRGEGERSANDDFASMREVIRRRYGHLKESGEQFPDLIMVDGGKGQLSSALEVLQSIDSAAQPLISLAKRLEEVFVPGESDPVSIPKTSSSLRLLQQLRDEAHRFAVTYHRSLRSKRTLQTELDLIEGIGKKKAKELLEVFGSVQGVKFASQEQLAEVVGEKTAEKIREHFAVGESIVEDGDAE